MSALGLLRSDPMLRNSGYLSLTVATMSFLGFLSWMVNAHLFAPATIGEATSLISAMSLIAYTGLLGFNSTLIRFLPTAEDPKAQIDTAITLCGLTSLVIGAGYVLLLPVLAPRLDFVRNDPLYAVGFVVLTACSGINLLTDSVFIAFREARYNFFVDGIIQGTTKVGLPLLLISLGAFGIYGSSGIAAALAVLASLYFMAKIFGHRFTPVVRWDVLRGALKFSLATYISSLFNLIPLLVVPLVVLDRDGAAAAGYYFIAFQLGNLLYSLSFAVSESLVAEGSRAQADLARLARRSIILIEAVAVAGAVVLAAGSHLILLLFGATYSFHASAALIGFAVGAPANALNTWASNLLKVTRQLSAMIVSNVVYAVVIVGAVWIYASRGIGFVALTWMLGNLASAMAALVALRVLAPPKGSHARGAGRARPHGG